MTELTRQAAQEEALRRWHNLPLDERRTVMHARVFAAGLVEELDFRTMADRRKLIEAWLVRDMSISAGSVRPEPADPERATAGPVAPESPIATDAPPDGVPSTDETADEPMSDAAPGPVMPRNDRARGG